MCLTISIYRRLGANRGYYPGAPAVAYPTAVTPAPVIAPVPVAPKVTPVAPVYKPVDNKLPAIVRQSQEVNFDGNFKYGYVTRWTRRPTVVTVYV